MDPAKAKTIAELLKKHQGEEAERLTLLPLVERFNQEVGTLILGQKSNLDLILWKAHRRQSFSKSFRIQEILGSDG